MPFESFDQSQINQSGGDTSNQSGIGGAIKGGSELLNSLGLGVIPSGLSSLYELPGFISRGFKGRTVEQAQQDNPFLTGQKARSIQKVQSGNVGEAFTEPLQEVAGAASWAVPLKAESLLTRAGLGGLMGLLKGFSSENTTPQSTAIDTGIGAGINAVLPPIFEKGAEALGRTSIGKGGEMLAQLMNESGNKITGTGEQILNTIYGKTAPIREKMATLLGDTSKTIGTHEMFGAPNIADEVANTAMSAANKAPDVAPSVISGEGTASKLIRDLRKKVTNPTAFKEVAGSAAESDATHATPNASSTGEDIRNMKAAQVGNKLPTTEQTTNIFDNALKESGTIGKDRATEYINGVKKQFSKHLGDYLDEIGLSSDAKAHYFGTTENVEVPVKVYNNLLQDVSADIKWASKANDPIQKVAKRVYFDLQDKIAQATGNPEEYARLNKLLQGSSQIKESLSKGGQGANIFNKLKSVGLPLESIIALGTGHPAAAGAGAVGTIATNPRIATNLLYGLSQAPVQDTSAKLIMNLLNQGGESQ